MDGREDDGVRFETDVDAPVERVWTCVVSPEHVRAWWAFGGAVVEARPGGRIEHAWPEHGRYLGVVDEVEPFRRFVYRSATLPGREPEPGAQTRVRVELTDLGRARTRVRITEDGFSRLATGAAERRAQLEAAAEGWSAGIALLAGRASSDDGPMRVA